MKSFKQFVEQSANDNDSDPTKNPNFIKKLSPGGSVDLAIKAELPDLKRQLQNKANGPTIKKLGILKHPDQDYD
jgi:hypothetical protein